MSEALITSRTEGLTRIVTVNRPQKRNALTPQMLEDLAAAVRAVDESPEIRAVVVAAEGPIFSAGIDVMSLAESQGSAGALNPARWLRRFAERLQHALDVIEATGSSRDRRAARASDRHGIGVGLIVRSARGQ